MLPVLNVGPLVIQIPALVLLVGLWIAFDLVERPNGKRTLDGAALSKALSYALVGGVVGARLIFAAGHLDRYVANPLGLLSIDSITLDPLGAVAVGGLLAVVFGRRAGLQLRPSLDAAVPGLAVMMFVRGVAHLLSGDAFGPPTDLPWAIPLWGEMRHPTQVYEILAAVAVYAAWRLRPASPDSRGVGFLRWFALQVGAMIFLEAFMADSRLWFGDLRAVQVVGLMSLAASLGVAHLWDDQQLIS
jgi:phosphatidylglycerol:prolipoprotein diacylglycerol transferase